MKSLSAARDTEVTDGEKVNGLFKESQPFGQSNKASSQANDISENGQSANGNIEYPQTFKETASFTGSATYSYHIPPDAQLTIDGRLSESSRSENSSRLSNDAGLANSRVKPVIKRKEVPNGIQMIPKYPSTDPIASLNVETSQAISPPSSPSKLATRHRRAQSASNPSSPTGSPLRSDYSRLDPSQTVNRFSTSSNQDVAPNSSSLSLQRPGSLRLQHRHTLQIPKLPTARVSRDFSFSQNNQSEEAVTTAISNVGGRRSSFNLTRRNTRSIHSDMFLDEIPQDADAARWAESVRQKRASRRRRKEEEEDDRVMVGTKVDQNHVNYVTAYNMLTGIRFTVSRTNAKLDRELTDADFDAKHKFSFDITGNELTPSAKYDFKFKDYAPWVFRHLRATFHLDPADYLISLTSKYILSELGSPGKSGSFFYFSRDYKYIIKTIHHAEHKLLRKILRDYYAHVQENSNTLISQFYGLHRVKIPYGRKIHFVVMNNLFPPHRDIHQTFDLKGSTVGRELKEEDLEKNPRATLKDLNWLRRNYHLEFGPMKKKLFIEQMERDVKLLQRLKIMDYSLLVGVHDLERGNDENLRDKTLKVFQPGGDQSDEPQSNVIVRTPSKLESAQKARALRQIIQRERPVALNQSTFQMPDEATENKNRSYFYSDDGGFRATHENGAPGEEIYYLGIIDCLTHYGFVKRLEHFWKGMSANKTQISPIPPEGYGDRFVKFINGITKPREEAEAEAETAVHPEMQQLDGQATNIRSSLDVHSSVRENIDSRSNSRIARLSPVQLMEQAERQARRSSSSEEFQPVDRTIKTVRSPSAERGIERGASVTLPVLEEVGEGGSMGGGSVGGVSANSANSREREREREPSERGRDDRSQHSRGRDSTPLASQSMLSPPLGGRPPPTPPKDMPNLEKTLPVLPMPDLPISPLQIQSNSRSSWLDVP